RDTSVAQLSGMASPPPNPRDPHLSRRAYVGGPFGVPGWRGGVGAAGRGGRGQRGRFGAGRMVEGPGRGDPAAARRAGRRRRRRPSRPATAGGAGAGGGG